MPRLSVIIPIEEKNLSAGILINSISNQTLRDMEIIVVNANAALEQLEICANHAELDNRIVILKQPQNDVNMAINRALDFASGDFITIADTPMQEKAYEILSYKIMDSNADVLFSNIKTENEMSFIEGEIKANFSKWLEDDAFFDSGNIVFRNKISEQSPARFSENPNAREDFDFIVSLIKTANKIILVPSDFRQQILNRKNEQKGNILARIQRKIIRNLGLSR